jgi:hypothetical protein
MSKKQRDPSDKEKVKILSEELNKLQEQNNAYMRDWSSQQNTISLYKQKETDMIRQILDLEKQNDELNLVNVDLQENILSITTERNIMQRKLDLYINQNDEKVKAFNNGDSEFDRLKTFYGREPKRPVRFHISTSFPSETEEEYISRTFGPKKDVLGNVKRLDEFDRKLAALVLDFHKLLEEVKYVKNP